MTIQNSTLELMVLLNAEVWGKTAENQTDWQRCAILMCEAHRLVADDSNKKTLMTYGWVDCTVNEVPFKMWCNYIVNILGDKGQVLIPALEVAAKEAIVRPDTKFEIGFKSSEWFALWGVDPVTPDV